MTLLQEAPDLVIVLVTEGEVGSAHFRPTQGTDDLLDRAARLTGRTVVDRFLGLILLHQRPQAAQFVGIIPLHPVTEAHRLLGLNRRILQNPHLAQFDELGQAVGLDVALAFEA